MRLIDRLLGRRPKPPPLDLDDPRIEPPVTFGADPFAITPQVSAMHAADLIRDALNGEDEEFRLIAGFAMRVSAVIPDGAEFELEIAGQPFAIVVRPR